VDEVREWAEEILEDINSEALFMDGLDGAIIGVTTMQAGIENSVVVYDEDLIIQELLKDGGDYEECWDHYGFNIQGAYVGPHTPIIIKRPSELGGVATGPSSELER